MIWGSSTPVITMPQQPCDHVYITNRHNDPNHCPGCEVFGVYYSINCDPTQVSLALADPTTFDGKGASW